MFFQEKLQLSNNESRSKESGDVSMCYKDCHYLGSSEALELEMLYEVHSNAT